MESRALEAMSPKAMVARIQQARFPQALQPAEVQLLATVAISYGLDPLMGELSIYQGRPYVGIDGRLRKAQETGRFAGIESRPATLAEREAWQIPDEDFFFRCEVYSKGVDRPFVGWGRVFERETHGKGFKPTETNPQRMAEKRAEAQALRKAFHIPLPSSEDIGAVDMELPPVPVGNCRVVDAQTGEVTEPQPAVATQPPAPEVPVGPPPASAPESTEPPPDALTVTFGPPMEYDYVTLIAKELTRLGITADEMGEWCNRKKMKAVPEMPSKQANAVLIWLASCASKQVALR